MNPKQTTGRSLCALVIVMTSAAGLVTPALAQDQDGVTAMCLERDAADVCACASEALRNEIGDDDYALYAAIGTDYLSRMAAGESRVDAWMEASRTEAGKRGVSGVALMGQTNEIGNLHRDAIKACGG